MHAFLSTCLDNAKLKADSSAEIKNSGGELNKIEDETLVLGTSGIAAPLTTAIKVPPVVEENTCENQTSTRTVNVATATVQGTKNESFVDSKMRIANIDEPLL
jgi:hypothetical protein